MPQTPPGGVPGGTGTSNQFPQWGVGGGTPGVAGGWNTVKANNPAQKLQDINNGYTTWFSSSSAATSFIKSESSAYGSGTGGLTGLAAIGDFFHRLTEANTWIRVGEFTAGALITYVGIKAVVAPDRGGVAQRTVRDTAKSASLKLAKLTPQGRVASKAVSHRKPRPGRGTTPNRSRGVVNPRTSKVYVDAPKGRSNRGTS
jgi:hypothetical protein